MHLFQRARNFFPGCSMCLLFVFLLCCHSQVRAGASDPVLTLKERAVSIEKIFKLIKSQTGYEFIYNTLTVENAKPVTIEVKAASLAEVLRICFAGQPFSYRIIDKTIIVSEKYVQNEVAGTTATSAALAGIAGRVTDEEGIPLEGVNIVLKSGRTVAVTKADGRFVMEVPDARGVLVFSFIGYADREVAVKGEAALTVTLVKSAAVLTDIVVVGYGKSSRQNLSSAVTTLKQEDLNRGAITDVGQLIQGKVAGINITASGDPNRPAAIVLRGASTINSSQAPFYVIDGIPGADISTIAPDDIASVDVLKDAAATAIYGNRAANGVIMITSKRGKTDKAEVAYNGYVGLEKVSNQIKMMNSSQLREFLAKNNMIFTAGADQGADTDWQSEILRPSAVSHNHNLSLSKGSAQTSYSASVNYAKKEGIIIGSDLTRVIARLAIDQHLLDDKVKLGLTLSNSNGKSNNVPNRNFTLLQSVSHLPVTAVRNADGTYTENLNTISYFNPVAMINEAIDNTTNNNLVGSLTAQVKLPFGLTYDLIVSYQNYSSMHGEYYGSYYTKYNGGKFYNNPDPPSDHTPITFGSNGAAVRSSYQNTNKTLETFLTWDKKLGYHSFKAVGGYSWQGNIAGDGFQTTSTNFTVDNLGYNNLGLSNPYAVSGYRINFGTGTVYQETRLISFFGRVNYNYKDKYLLQGSVRRDGSSVFGENNRWGYFPAVGAAWRINKEAFMAGQSFFSDLKLRASYGVTGNATGFDAYTSRFISGILGTAYNNGIFENAFGPVQAANPDLKWEKTATANLGLDFSILKGAVSGTLDVYNKKTTGMIYSYNVDPILIPTKTVIANGGSMSNKGVELSVMATPVTTSRFSWTTGINLAHNKNEITSLSNPSFAGGDSIPKTSPGGEGQTGASLQLLKAGKPVGQFYTFEYAGKNASGISQYYDSKGNLTTSPLLGTDYHYAGSPQPKLLLGFSNNFRYGNVDLNVFFRGVFGNKIFNATRADLFRPAVAHSYNMPVDAADESIADKPYIYSSRFIESGSYLRLDNATLGYNFRKLSRYIKTCRVYAAVNNLFVITRYKGIDPEINQGGIAPGVDANNFYPKTRTFLLGLNVTL